MSKALLHIEATHPGVLESVRRLLAGENEVALTTVRDFDENQYQITVEEDGSALLVSMNHRLNCDYFTANAVVKSRLEKVLLRHLTLACKGKEDKARAALAETPQEGFVATIRIPLANVDEHNVTTNKLLIVSAQMRHLVLYAPFLWMIDKYNAAAKPTPATVPSMMLPYRQDETLYLYVGGSGSLHCVMSIIAADHDDVTFIKHFLKEYEFTRKQDKSIGLAPGFGFSTDPVPVGFPSDLKPREKPSDMLMWVTFTMQKSLLEPLEKAENTIFNVVNFRQFLLYHIQCCKSFLHFTGRARVKKVEQVINRAKTNTTGVPRVQIE